VYGELNAKVAVILGPEEGSLRDGVISASEGRWTILEPASLLELAAVLSTADVVIGNDTGPIHLAAAVGTPIILLMQAAAPDRYLPLAERLTVHRGGELDDISVDDVFASVKNTLSLNEK